MDLNYDLQETPLFYAAKQATGIDPADEQGHDARTQKILENYKVKPVQLDSRGKIPPQR